MVQQEALTLFFISCMESPFIPSDSSPFSMFLQELSPPECEWSVASCLESRAVILRPHLRMEFPFPFSAFRKLFFPLFVGEASFPRCDRTRFGFLPGGVGFGLPFQGILFFFLENGPSLHGPGFFGGRPDRPLQFHFWDPLRHFLRYIPL